MKLYLKRNHYKPDYIIGSLFIDDKYFADTLERPWIDNKEDISCIPVGIYPVKMLPSEHFQRDLPHILNVPNRTLIMIHPANFVQELKGCVAVGKNTIKGGLTDSRIWSNKLNDLIVNSPDPVTIEVA